MLLWYPFHALKVVSYVTKCPVPDTFFSPFWPYLRNDAIFWYLQASYSMIKYLLKINNEDSSPKGDLYLQNHCCVQNNINHPPAITFPRLDSDWLMAAPSFRRSPVAPVESALSLGNRNNMMITNISQFLKKGLRYIIQKFQICNNESEKAESKTNTLLIW